MSFGNEILRYSCQLRVMLSIALTIGLLSLGAQVAGDYRTKWAGNLDILGRWETYNGSSWVSASEVPASPFSGTMYILHQTDVHRSFTVIGRVIVSNGSNSSQFRVMNGGVFTLAAAAQMDFDNIYIAPGGTLINDGTMQAVAPYSQISIQADGELINNALITTPGDQSNLLISTHTSGIDHPARFTSGAAGAVVGRGSFTANYNSVITTAHPGGLDESLKLSNGNNLSGAYFVFNGNTPQVTGTTMPEMALGIVFANPHTVSLSQDIRVVNEINVQGGTSLNLGNSVIYPNYFGAGEFTMEDGSRVATTHPDGLASTGNRGNIRVAIRNYNTNATYVYNGTTPQQTGDFITSPDPYTVVNLIIDNPSGVEITNPLTVTGTMEVIEGGISYIDPPTGIDGYYSPLVHRVEIAQNGVLMYNFQALTQSYTNSGAFVNRKWLLKGHFNGAKRVTLNWTEAEDGGFNWSIHNRPQVYVSNRSTPLNSSWNPNEPRQVTFTAHEFPNLRDEVYYTIGLGNDETLPVALSTFTANATAGGKVQIRWVTQSETNTAGFFVYRNDKGELASALRIGDMLPAQNSSQTQVYMATDSEALPGTTYYYWLEAVSYDHSSDFFGPVTVSLEPNLGFNPVPPVVTGISLISPNPMNSNARISYGIAAKGVYRLEIFNLRGQKIRTLKQESADKGNYQLYWDGRDDSGSITGSGVYFVRLSHQGQHWQTKLTVVK